MSRQRYSSNNGAGFRQPSIPALTPSQKMSVFRKAKSLITASDRSILARFFDTVLFLGVIAYGISPADLIPGETIAVLDDLGVLGLFALYTNAKFKGYLARKYGDFS